MEFYFDGVNDAFKGLVGCFEDGWDGGEKTEYPIEEPSRNGPVLRLPEPAMIHYVKPLDRVLFNQTRDANPFSLLYEALWMLAGRNDVDSIAYYTKRFREFSDDGKTLNGAYGYRWRHSGYYTPEEYSPHDWNEVDQLDLLVAHLKAQPDSRRAVLQMWNVEDDLLKIGTPTETTTSANKEYRTWNPDPNYSKDVCCNLSVMFSLRELEKTYPIEQVIAAVKAGDDKSFSLPIRYALDMTVVNRSNDMIWGMLGANFVTFSVLQEYMAARLGVQVGRYTQMSNNLHCYKSNWKPDEWLSDVTPNIYDIGCPTSMRPGEPYNPTYTYQWKKVVDRVPLVKDPEVFEHELPKIVERHSRPHRNGTGARLIWNEPFFNDVVEPMCMAFHCHKLKQREPQLTDLMDGSITVNLSEIKDDAWKFACHNWLARRIQRVSNAKGE